MENIEDIKQIVDEMWERINEEITYLKIEIVKLQNFVFNTEDGPKDFFEKTKSRVRQKLKKNLLPSFTTKSEKLFLKIISIVDEKNDVRSKDKTENELKVSFGCKWCTFNSLRPDRLQKHALRMHPGKEDLEKFEQNIKEEALVDVKPQIDDNSEVPDFSLDYQRTIDKDITGYQCNKCNFTFDSTFLLSNHIEQYHNIIMNEQVSKEDKVRKKNSINKNKPRVCKDCGEKLNSRLAFRYHRTKYHSVSICEQCNKTCNTREGLRYHMKQHKNITYPCAKCPREYKTSRSLRDHTKGVHENIRDHLCTDCGIRFVRRQKFLLHVRTKHTFEKPYVCDSCEAAFYRSDKLQLHKRKVHTGERPYGCVECEWRGFESSDFIHHRQRHEKQRKSRGE